MIKKIITLRDGVEHGRIINGCWQFSSGHSDNTQTPIHVLQSYIDAGFTTFDGADIYSWVEEVFWEVWEQNRDNKYLRFHTKHVPDLDDVISGNISLEKTISQISRSCERMQTQVLDNVQFHWWGYKKSWYEISLSALMGLQSEWLIKHIWVTNCNVAFLKTLEQELWFVPMTTQNQYSIIDRRPETYLVPYILERDIGLYCYGSLMWGLLTDRYLGKDKPQEPLENRSLRKYLRVIDDWADWDTFQELLSVLSSIWNKYSVNIAQISIAWLLHQKSVSSVIVWVRNTKYIDSLNDIFWISLSFEDMKAIDTIYDKWTALFWDVFDLERNESRHRDIMKYNLNKDES